MVKVAFDAGHAIPTPGKRTPTGEREWTFNDKVVRHAMMKLTEYENVQLLRTDDESGRVDAPLAARTNQANNWKADIFVSVHHNALGTSWGDHEGTETFVYVPMSKNPKSKKLADCVHPRIVTAMQTKDRGIKDANFAVLRDSNMPAILTEGGFMDSRSDIQKMRNDKFLKSQGEAIALGIVEYFGLKLKEVVKPVIKEVSNKVEAKNAEKLTAAQQKVVDEAKRLRLIDGKEPFGVMDRIYLYSVLVGLAQRVEELEKERKA